MIKIDSKTYKVCFLDTCVISDFFENKDLYRSFINFMLNENLIVTVSVSTIIELKKISEKYDRFKNDFTKFPTFLLKPSQMILEDEMDSYPNKNTETFLLSYLFKNKDLLDHLDNSDKFQTASKYLDTDKQNVLDSILALKPNFIPNKNGKYSDRRMKEFVNDAIIQQLSRFYSDWTKSQLLKNQEINTALFKSLNSQLLITFWKFYLMKDRKVKESDVFDITMASSFPYVDFVITEKNMKNDIMQIKSKGLLFDELEPMTIKNLT